MKKLLMPVLALLYGQVSPATPATSNGDVKVHTTGQGPKSSTNPMKRDVSYKGLPHRKKGKSR